ncbi:hypothetical protein VTK56DRAFT_10058 [Thermocarpiscus australiensis]
MLSRSLLHASTVIRPALVGPCQSVGAPPVRGIRRRWGRRSTPRLEREIWGKTLANQKPERLVHVAFASRHDLYVQPLRQQVVKME